MTVHVQAGCMNSTLLLYNKGKFNWTNTENRSDLWFLSELIKQTTFVWLTCVTLNQYLRQCLIRLYCFANTLMSPGAIHPTAITTDGDRISSSSSKLRALCCIYGPRPINLWAPESFVLILVQDWCAHVYFMCSLRKKVLKIKSLFMSYRCQACILHLNISWRLACFCVICVIYVRPFFSPAYITHIAHITGSLRHLFTTNT